jgi:hypothetical protein
MITYNLGYNSAACYGKDNLKKLKSLPSIQRVAPKVRDRYRPNPYLTRKASDARYEAWKTAFARSGNGVEAVMLTYQVKRYEAAHSTASNNVQRMKREEAEIRKERAIRRLRQYGMPHLGKRPVTKPENADSLYCNKCGERQDFLLTVEFCETCMDKLFPKRED